MKSLSLRGQGKRIPRRQCLGDTPCRRRCPSLVGDPAAEEWSPWSVCSLTCGQGLQVRTRSCVSSPYGTLCSGPLRETRPCNNSATCPGMPILPAWSACRVRSCLGLGQVHLPKMVVCLLLSFSKVDCLSPPAHHHPCPAPTQGIGDTDESDQEACTENFNPQVINRNRTTRRKMANHLISAFPAVLGLSVKIILS